MDGSPWQIQQSLPEIISLTVSNLQMWFLTPSQLSSVLNAEKFSQIRIAGLYFGVDVSDETLMSDFAQYLDHISTSSTSLTLGLHHSVHEGAVGQLITERQKQSALKKTVLGIYDQHTFDSVFSQLCWFYDIFIGQLLLINQQRQPRLSSDRLLSQKERTDIHALYSRSLDDED
ncbi:MAG: hypothetical protein ACFFBD_01850 [Candidatus Hodarchaeota archaeon]